MQKNKQNFASKDNRNKNIAVLQEAGSLAQSLLKSGLSSILLTDNYYTLVTSTRSINIPVKYDIKGLWLSKDVFKDETAGNLTKLGSIPMKSIGFAVVLITDQKIRTLVAKDLYNKGIPVLAIVNNLNVIPKQIKYAVRVDNQSLSLIDTMYNYFHQLLLSGPVTQNQTALPFLEKVAEKTNSNEVLKIIRARQSKQLNSN
jgi:hypothetical protein